MTWLKFILLDIARGRGHPITKTFLFMVPNNLDQSLLLAHMKKGLNVHQIKSKRGEECPPCSNRIWT